MSTALKLAGVVGWPVHHSLSPLLHNHWLKRHAIPGVYVPLAIRPEDFGASIAQLPKMGFAGVNVTVPHKEAAFALCAEIDEDARATGAVNTLIFEMGRIVGRNTDVRGFKAALRETLGADAASKGPVVVLGAGGAARGVVRALSLAGAPEIRILNRTKARAEILAASFAPAVKIRAFDWADWAGALAGARLLVNTTSLGMVGKDALDVSLDALPANAAVADIVYNPLQTELLRAAQARGLRTMGGLGMLMHQAVPAFAAWFGVTPDVTLGLRAELEGVLPLG